LNRLFLVRHGGSTGNEDETFYQFNDSALCLTTNGIRQALSTAGVLASISPRWVKPGDFALEAYASQYTRAQQTARIVLDQMALLSVEPRIRPLLNERDYGTKYEKRMDEDAEYDANDSESAVKARARVIGFLDEIDSVLYRADVVAFSHYGAIRALIANILNLTNDQMMELDVPNGRAFFFVRTFDPTGKQKFVQQPLPDHVLEKTASHIKVPAGFELHEVTVRRMMRVK
jgi:broad specificity phosphatase PhoE